MSLQEKINAASKRDGGVINIPKGVHHIDKDVYCFYHPQLNPGYNKNPESWSRITLRGVNSGGTSRNVSQGAIDTNYNASHLAFATGKRLVVADTVLMGEAAGVEHAVSGGFVSSDLAISGNNPAHLVRIDGCPRTSVDRWNIYNADGGTLFLHGVWESDFRSVYAKTGGFSSNVLVSTYRYAGGLLNMENLTVEGGWNGLSMTDGGSGKAIGAMTLKHFQARKCNNGIAVFGGVRNLDLLMPWFEHIERDCVNAYGHSFRHGRLYVRGGSWWTTDSSYSAQTYINFDRVSGDLITDAWYPLERFYIETVRMSDCTGKWVNRDESRGD